MIWLVCLPLNFFTHIQKEKNIFSFQLFRGLCFLKVLNGYLIQTDVLAMYILKYSALKLHLLLAVCPFFQTSNSQSIIQTTFHLIIFSQAFLHS